MRDEVEARPSVALFIAFVLGLVAVGYWPAFIGIIVFLAWLRPFQTRCLLAGSFVVGLALSPSPPKLMLEPMAVHGIGTVVSVPGLREETQTFDFDIGKDRLSLTVPREPPVMLGDRLSVSGIAKPLPLGVLRMVQPDGVRGRLDASQWSVVGEGSFLAHLADTWRRSFVQFFGRNLAPRDAELVDAICFNTRSMIDPQTRQELANSGTIHIVSASGLQVFVFSMFVSLVLGLVPIPRWVQVAVLGCLLVVYSLAAGLQPQIVRAAVMCLMGMAAYLFKREPDALSALALSGIGYLLWRPGAVYGMAFQLSFITVALLALFFRRQSGVPKGSQEKLIWLTYDFLQLSAIVMLATTPLVAYYLGVVSPASVFANLMVIWSLPLLVGGAFFAHAVSIVVPAVGDAIATHFLTPLSHWIYGVIGWVGDGSGIVVVPEFNALWLVAFYGAWLMTYRRRVVQP